jgi:chromosomal replication initiation ATPase DnaA
MKACHICTFKIMVYSIHGFVPLIEEPKFEVNSILSTIVTVLGVYKSQIAGKCRRQTITEAKYIAVRIVKDSYPGYSLKWVGGHFNRDHSSVIYALTQFQNWFDTDPDFRTKYNLVINRLKGGKHE